MKMIIAAILLATMAGCTLSQQAASQAAVQKIRTTNDTIAQGLIASICGMTLGAYQRLPYPAMRRGIDALCGGER